MKKATAALVIGLLFLYFLSSSTFLSASAQTSNLSFAIVGDYGTGNEYAAAVASLIDSWNPDLILASGDDYVAKAGGKGSRKYDRSTGQFYCKYLKDVITGTFCPGGQASSNRFFPALGDHDYDDGGTTNGLPATYTSYFTLPGNGLINSSGNERYYDFISGPVHFFVLNSIAYPGAEPDGVDATSAQAWWLREQLGASTSTWNIVYFHHPPYSSGAKHGSTPYMQWPFTQWGADAVISGHDHVYERIQRDGIVYFVNGLGGQWFKDYGFVDTPIEGSVLRYNQEYGAQKVTASNASLTFEFYSLEGGSKLIDRYTLTSSHSTPSPSPIPSHTPTPTSTLPPQFTEWKNPAGHAPMSGGDGNGFEISPSNVFADDGLFAVDMNSGASTSTSCTENGKDKHRFYDYGITLPAGAVVQGIRLRLDARASSTVGTPKMCASLSWDNGATWTDWKNTSALVTQEATYLLGSPYNTWGHIWTRDEISILQVRVLNAASNVTTDFSLDWVPVQIAYYINPAAPAQPALLAPAAAAQLKTVRSDFDWADVSGADSYQIQVSATSNFSTRLVNTNVNTSFYRIPKDLPRNSILYWRVRAKAYTAAGQWSKVRSFKTGNPPSTPALVSPAANALSTNYKPRLDWTNSSLPAGTTFDRYQLQVSTVSDFSALYLNVSIRGVTSSEYRLTSALQPDTKYYWRVRAFNTNGHYSTWSAVRSLRSAMRPPVLLSPANTGTVSDVRPPFTWSSVSGATGYTIQVSPNQDMSLPLINTQVSAATYTPEIDLPPGVTLFWRVRATGPNGPSLWSTKFSFRIN